MTDHNIISAEQWPEDAHAIVWDSDGQSLELHLFGSDWGLVYTHPNIDMPPDHDWRVPVMRPTCKESLPVAPAIDLEQFRGLLAFVRDGCKNGPIMQARARELLALIDGQASRSDEQIALEKKCERRGKLIQDIYNDERTVMSRELHQRTSDELIAP